MIPKILIFGDMSELDRMFGRRDWFTSFGPVSVNHSANFEAVIRTLKSGGADCLLLACRGANEAADLLERGLEADPGVPVVITCAELSGPQTVRLLQSGARNCFGPGHNIKSFLGAIFSATREVSHVNAGEVTGTMRKAHWRERLVGSSPAIEEVVERIRLVASRRCTVLISGETGTGKEVAARAIHQASPRADREFVAVNCSAIPDNLLESELFGHTRGAFTGATASRVGRFEQANGGTLFLDEIAEMPPDLQAKLLRVLQERELQKVGSSETVKLDTRVIAATNLDLPEQIQKGRFREDLFYRLNVVPLRMPPLRERASDIPGLVAHFVRKVCRAEEIPLKRVTPEALAHLRSNPWPGNVRQLENLIEMAVALSGERDVIHPRDLGVGEGIASVPDAAPESDRGISSIGWEPGMGFERAVSQFELAILQTALREACGNKTAAAERLGMKRTTLIMKMRSFEQSGRLATGT